MCIFRCKTLQNQKDLMENDQTLVMGDKGNDISRPT